MKKLNKKLLVYLCGRKKSFPDFTLHDVKSILINPLGDAVGDAVVCTSYAKQLKTIYPNAKIGIFCTNRNRDILAHCPSIDVLIENELTEYFKQREKWDLLIDFNENFNSRDLIRVKILSAKLVMIFKKKFKSYYNLDNIHNYDYYCPYSRNEHVSKHLNTSILADLFQIPEPKIDFVLDENELKNAPSAWKKIKNSGGGGIISKFSLHHRVAYTLNPYHRLTLPIF